MEWIGALDHEILVANRIATMGLGGKKFSTTRTLLKKIGAVQCQDLQAGKWALGLRVKNPTQEKIEKELQTENIIRTHVLRPTWHFVLPEDIRWMLELTAPNIRKVMTTPFRNKEVTNELCKKTRSALQELLETQEELSHKEIQTKLAEHYNIKVEGIKLQLLLMDAEIEQLICNGSDMTNQATYTLFDKKVPFVTSLSRQEAVEKLTLMFFTGHGPATIQDCSRWTGLPIGEIKKGLKNIQERKDVELQEKGGYLYSNDLIEEEFEPGNYLLPRYDEYFNGYKDKNPFLPNYENKKAKELNYNPILEKGQIIGKWTKKITKSKVQVNYDYFKEVDNEITESIMTKAIDYAKFLQKNLVG